MAEILRSKISQNGLLIWAWSWWWLSLSKPQCKRKDESGKLKSAHGAWANPNQQLVLSSGLRAGSDLVRAVPQIDSKTQNGLLALAESGALAGDLFWGLELRANSGLVGLHSQTNNPTQKNTRAEQKVQNLWIFSGKSDIIIERSTAKATVGLHTIVIVSLRTPPLRVPD